MPEEGPSPSNPLEQSQEQTGALRKEQAGITQPHNIKHLPHQLEIKAQTPNQSLLTFMWTQITEMN